MNLHHNEAEFQDLVNLTANYYQLHNTLLYTNQKQDWNKVDAVFSEIDGILSRIKE